MNEMEKLWSEENKYAIWWRVELAACQANWRLGKLSYAGYERLSRLEVSSVSVFKEEEEVTHHDVTAFVNVMARRDPEVGKFIHFGLTSSDVVDTALSLQMRGAFDLLLGLGRREYGGLLVSAQEAISVGKFSGAVGTYSQTSPRFEALACERLGLVSALISSQILQRDRHAQAILALALVGSHLAALYSRYQERASLLRGYAMAALENVALWGERDISHSSAERIIIPQSFLLLYEMLLEGSK